MRVRFWVDLNSESVEEEIDVTEYVLDEDEWYSLSAIEKQSIVHDWAMQHIQFGYQE